MGQAIRVLFNIRNSVHGNTRANMYMMFVVTISSVTRN